MISAVITIIKLLPEFLALGKTILAMLLKYQSDREAAEKLKELHAAVIDAHKTGDTSGLEKLFNGGVDTAAPAMPQQLPVKPANS